MRGDFESEGCPALEETKNREESEGERKATEAGLAILVLRVKPCASLGVSIPRGLASKGKPQRTLLTLHVRGQSTDRAPKPRYGGRGTYKSHTIRKTDLG